MTEQEKEPLDQNQDAIPTVSMAGATAATSQSRPRQSQRGGQKRKRSDSVVQYIAILFGAAFILLVMTFAMERRKTDEMIDGLNDTISGLRQSASAMQTAQDLYETNIELLAQVQALQLQLEALETQQVNSDVMLNGYKVLAQGQKRSIEALDWFWQINEAYVRGRTTTARKLIESMTALDLVIDLPTASVTDNGRFSPAERFQEIYDALY